MTKNVRGCRTKGKIIFTQSHNKDKKDSSFYYSVQCIHKKESKKCKGVCPY